LTLSDSVTIQQSPEKKSSFSEVLKNWDFVYLWLAQALAQTAQNGIHFVQIVLIEELTGSSQHIGIMILAFSLPAVAFSSVAGVVVDRVSKKQLLVFINILRVVTALSYLLALHSLDGLTLLLFIYLITFFASALGQFFSPAEVAMIPTIVKGDSLLPANSLFNLTLSASQIAGLIIVFPMTVKLGELFVGPGMGIRLSFVLVAVLYAAATLLVSRLPHDEPNGRTANGKRTIAAAWEDVREGWQFVRTRATIYVPIIHLTLLATLVMVVAMLAPGFATRVLRVSTEDSVYIFMPAGLGMFIGTYLIGRFGDNFRREMLSNVGALAEAFTLAVLGFAGWIASGRLILIPIVMLLSLFVGFEFSLIGVPAQTVLQERAPEEIRGRVFAMQFLLTNLIAIPPMLFIGTLADWISIPPVLILVGGGTLLVALWCVYYTYHVPRLAPDTATATAAGRPGKHGPGLAGPTAASELQPVRLNPGPTPHTEVDAPKRILFLIADTGGGHRAAAEAICDAISSLHLESPPETSLVDFLVEGAQPPFNRIGRLYRPTVDHAPSLWLSLFRLTASSAGYHAALTLLDRLMRPGLTRLLKRHPASLVVSVHPMANHVPAQIVHSMNSGTPFVTVVTDLATAHPLWFAPEVDHCLVPTEAARQRALRAGLPEDKTEIVGLPIKPAFAALRAERERVRANLGLQPDRLVILLVGGGEGMGHLYEQAIALDEADLPLQLVVVAGRNDSLRQRLQQRRWNQPTIVYGFVHNMPELMAACDAIVTKAGPGTVSESLAAGLPMLISGYIPGQEGGNVSYVVEGGAGVLATTPEAIVAQLRKWVAAGPEAMSAISRNALALAHPDAAEKIARRLIQFANRQRPSAE